MKKKVIAILIIIIPFASISQNYFTDGIIPSNSFLIGMETGGSYTVIEAEYSITGKKIKMFGLRTVPKIAYAPFENLLIGAYYEYEFINVDGIKHPPNFGYGGFVRYYFPFINNFLHINKSKFLNNRLLFFSELYIEKNNYILMSNGDTGVSDNLNTIFYGAKLGADFRLFNKVYLEIAYVQNFDNHNGDFQVFHHEIGIGYIFNYEKQRSINDKKD